jgi:predicted CXXCH cytochrome family protein
MSHRFNPVLWGLLVPVLVACFAGALPAQITSAIEGTPHDFTPEGGETTDGCVVCHLTPEDGGSKGGPAAMGQGTLMCLSCHDGVSASSSGGESTSHPSSVAYPDADGYRSLDEVEERGAHLATGEDGPRVECTSCHNPHDNELGSFLRVSNAGSALCFSCHIT